LCITAWICNEHCRAAEPEFTFTAVDAQYRTPVFLKSSKNCCSMGIISAALFAPLFASSSGIELRLSNAENRSRAHSSTADFTEPMMIARNHERMLVG